MKLFSLKNYLSILMREKIYVLISSLSLVISVLFESSAIIILSAVLINKDLKILNINFSFPNNILTFLFLALSASTLHYFSEKFIIRIQVLIEKYIRINTTNYLLGLGWIEFMKFNQGDISKSLSVEGFRISSGAVSLLRAFNCFISSIIYFIAAIIINKTIAVVLSLYLIFVLPIYYLYSQKAKQKSKNLSFQAEIISSISNKIFNNLKLLKASGVENSFRKISFKAISDYACVYEKSLLTIYKSKLVFELIAASFIFTILFFRSESIFLISSIGLFIRMAPKVSSTQTFLIQSLTELSYLNSYRERVSKHKNYLKNVRETKLKKINFQKLKIKLDSVFFSYSSNTDNILENCNLEIKKDEFIAIVGKSGAGKSTISDLITGLIKAQKGRVEIGTNNIEKIDVVSWRQKIGIVMQNAFLIDDSLANNVVFGSNYFDEKKIINSLKLSGAWEFVKDFENDIYENMYDYGSRLSGGQKQRISIARALYREPEILILDEPTSSLDPISEGKLKDTINSLKGKLTIIIITHRMNIIDSVDKIYELKDKKLTLKNNKNLF
tara:strand:- start:319 stop:1986 length:1668 start_codon:yes stop_codon:yes gene_type:complete